MTKTQTPSAEFQQVEREFNACSPEDQASYIGYIHSIALSAQKSRNAIESETATTMMIGGYELEKLSTVIREGLLCWQTFTTPGAPWASIELRRVQEKRKRAVYHLLYLPARGTIPAGRMVFRYPANAYQAAKDLGADFPGELGPRGD